MKMDWLTQRCQLPAAQSCTRPGCFTLLLVITLSLLMYPVLKSLGLQLHSAVTGSYISGTHSIAFINCPNEQVAKDIARAIMDKKLAACVNILPKASSMYFWEGEIEEATEILLLVKTRTSKISELSDYISVPTASCDLTLSSPPRPRKRSSSSTSRSPLRTGPRPFAKPKLVNWKSTPPWPTP
ncbi:protein CutA homolog isoform X1 [Lepidochelys kempii]|uniref:protein CutA homolog isoform X1 n=2 Tax=Lepidochelys kempii TaxID=8472 RepID=UPI003C6FD9B8